MKISLSEGCTCDDALQATAKAKTATTAALERTRMELNQAKQGLKEMGGGRLAANCKLHIAWLRMRTPWKVRTWRPRTSTPTA